MRGQRIIKKPIENDPIYKSRLVTRIINYVMQGGKKSVSEKIVYGAMSIIKEKKNTENPLTIIEQAFKNVTPKMEVRSRRVGGSNYQIPVHVKFDRAQALAVRWIVGAARSKKGKPMAERLAQLFIESAEGRGEAVKKKEDIRRMADANRAFAHFRW
jgi:small subunit ribosomal protein S7